MKQKIYKKLVQAQVEEMEFMSVKRAALLKGHASVGAYIRSLLEKDIIAYKNEIKNPSMMSMMTDYEWSFVSPEQVERFKSQMADIPKPSMALYLAQQSSGRPMFGDSKFPFEGQ